MLLKRFVAILLLIPALALPVMAEDSVPKGESNGTVDGNGTGTGDGHGDAHAHHGLPKKAPLLFYGFGGDSETGKVGWLAVNNSMVVMMVVAVGLILVAQTAMRRPQLVPSGLQNFVEWLVESLHEFFASIVGDQLIKKTFWFFATIFIMILFSNWIGLVPGLGSVGWAEPGHHNEHITTPLLRGVNADLNMTLAMASIFMVLWIVWCVQSIGVGGVAGHIFNVKGHGAGFLGFFLVVVFIFVGLIEVVSIAVRPVALTFRLYGNVFAGENMLESLLMMGGIAYGWLAALPFYFLELLVGLVQALVFALLTSVFTALMCEHHDEEHSH